MYGLLLSLLGYSTKTAWIFGVGLELSVDELTYLLMGGKTHEDNYSKISVLGTAFFAVVILLLRSQIVGVIQ